MTRVGSVHFVTYASQNFRRTQELLARSALEHGKVDHVHLFGPEDIKSTRFYEMHRATLEAPTGAGYWLWKPYVILQQLGRIRDGDFVLYCDCGRGDGQRVRRPIGPLIEWAMDAGSGVMPGISIPQYGKNAQWTKRDCFVYMGCDSNRFWDSPQIQTTVSLWQKNSFTADFVATWLDYCCDPRILTDQPNTCGKDNLPGFIEHRRDQSVLTNLILRHDIPYISSESRLTGWMMNLTRNCPYFLRGAIDFAKDINNVVERARGMPTSFVYAMDLTRRVQIRIRDAFGRGVAGHPRS